MDGIPCDRMEVVWIVWKDACGDSARVQIDSVKDCSLVTNTNLGWIIHENEERVILAHGVSTGGEIDYFAIPSNCIVDRIYLSKPRKESKNVKKSSRKRRSSR